MASLFETAEAFTNLKRIQERQRQEDEERQEQDIADNDNATWNEKNEPEQTGTNEHSDARLSD